MSANERCLVHSLANDTSLSPCSAVQRRASKRGAPPQARPLGFGPQWIRVAFVVEMVALFPEMIGIRLETSIGLLFALPPGSACQLPVDSGGGSPGKSGHAA